MFCWQGTYVEGIKEEVVLSPAHALSLIAAGEGIGTYIPLFSYSKYQPCFIYCTYSVAIYIFAASPNMLLLMSSCKTMV